MKIRFLGGPRDYGWARTYEMRISCLNRMFRIGCKLPDKIRGVFVKSFYKFFIH
jgi:hypothetical protein